MISFKIEKKSPLPITTTGSPHCSNQLVDFEQLQQLCSICVSHVKIRPWESLSSYLSFLWLYYLWEERWYFKSNQYTLQNSVGGICVNWKTSNCKANSNGNISQLKRDITIKVTIKRDYNFRSFSSNNNPLIFLCYVTVR